MEISNQLVKTSTPIFIFEASSKEQIDTGTTGGGDGEGTNNKQYNCQ